MRLAESFIPEGWFLLCLVPWLKAESINDNGKENSLCCILKSKEAQCVFTFSNILNGVSPLDFLRNRG